MRVAAAILLLAVLLAAVPRASAQGCAMCRASAEAAGANSARVMDQAILVLLIPTVSIFVGVVLFALRYRNRSRYEDPPGGEENLLPHSRPPDDAQSHHPFR